MGSLYSEDNFAGYGCDDEEEETPQKVRDKPHTKAFKPNLGHQRVNPPLGVEIWCANTVSNNLFPEEATQVGSTKKRSSDLASTS